MKIKLNVEATGIRGVLVFEGLPHEVGTQLRKALELLVPVGAGAENTNSQPQPSAAPEPHKPTENSRGVEEVNAEAKEEQLSATPAFSHLSFSTLALLFRCAHAFHLKLAGITPPPSEDQRIGQDFHAGVAAFLRGEDYAFEFAQNEVRFGHIKELLFTLRQASDLAIEPREVLEAGGIEWVGYADAIADGTIYEFKATKRLPTAPLDAHALQASVYASMFGAKKAKIVYVTEKEAREFDVAPLAGVREFLADMAGQIRAGVPNIPTGLTHPWGCDRCEYRTHCRFYDFVRGNGIAEVSF